MKPINRKGAAIPLVTLLLLAIAGLLIWQTFGKGGDNDDDSLSVTVSTGGQAATAAKGCDGIASVKDLYNDVDYFKAGTDPASHVTYNVMNGAAFFKVIADDATSSTLGVESSFSGVAGSNAGTPKAGYFSELVELDTGCADFDHIQKLYPSGAPTITVVNSNGITVNSDANDESLGASDTKTVTFKIVAPSEACAMRHGALLVLDYDATYFNSFSSSDMTKKSVTVRLPGHNLTGGINAGTNDQWESFLVSGQLCDGASLDQKLTIKTSSTQPTEDVNIDYYFLPLDIDVDADTYEALEPAAWDEDNNAIHEAQTNSTIYAS